MAFETLELTHNDDPGQNVSWVTTLEFMTLDRSSWLRMTLNDSWWWPNLWIGKAGMLIYWLERWILINDPNLNDSQFMNLVGRRSIDDPGLGWLSMLTLELTTFNWWFWFRVILRCYWQFLMMILVKVTLGWGFLMMIPVKVTFGQ